MKKVKRIILIILGVILSVFIILFLIVWINSPGKLKPLKDETGKKIERALVEKEWLEIGGIKQGFFIRSENPDNPVILYLHGGPGSPELPLIEATEKSERLEKYFTVCYWDQRGAGMTYHKGIDAESATVPQYVEDTREITEYLIKRFGKEKIYLMGHSWGSYLGAKVIQKYPGYYYAYMGIGQVTHQHLSEQLAYQYMMERAKETNDKKVIKSLSKYDPNVPGFPTNEYLITARMPNMNKYGIGITHKPYSMFSLIKDVLLFKGYTLSDKSNYTKGNMFSLKNVFPYVIADNLFESSISFQTPVYVIHGLYDYQVSHELAKKWVDSIQAPDKRLYTFQNSAHSPNMEEQTKFVTTVREIAGRHK